MYFLRVRANLFFDYSTVKSLRTGTETDLRSTGVEIYFDTRWWNQQFVSFGFRYSRLLYCCWQRSRKCRLLPSCGTVLLLCLMIVHYGERSLKELCASRYE